MKITKLFLVLVLSDLMAITGFAQIPPGDLSKGHAQLTGINLFVDIL